GQFVEAHTSQLPGARKTAVCIRCPPSPGAGLTAFSHQHAAFRTFPVRVSIQLVWDLPYHDGNRNTTNQEDGMSQHSFRNVNGPIVVGSSAILLAVILWLWPLAARSAKMLPAALAPAGLHGPYSTNFPRAENPISEGGKWYNGQTNGLDWANVRTSPGFAFGTEIGGSRPEPQKYDDSTALLEGTWGPSQTVQGTVRSANQN